ncbi:MAG TPA: capsule biosynthesis protein [Bosea sp. (in: a-proteobacteria)]|jgi:capsular polysaccharide transport system permease protein|uniref:capsule biosynthesis protein n=1 Tax=Bosea sp. (in: a-proteobacteria) TaxID=1871050 RepID=UPI002E10A370|nr:capsule biosynthesis protein [Bosea sp. (in: a-proteobacteria)]
MRDRIEKISRRLRPMAHSGRPPASKRFGPLVPGGEGGNVGDPASEARFHAPPVRLSRTKLAFMLLVLLPTALSAAYFGLIASDRFVSESTFVVRSAKSPLAGGLGSLLQIVGVSRSQDDSYSVQEYLQSRDAVAALSQTLPLRQIFDRPGADFIARYPNLLYGPSEEELFQYYKTRVSVVHGAATGLTTLKVETFLADDAIKINKTLLDLGEALVNRMNERIRADAIRFSEAEVKRGEERLVETQVAITEFRNRELMLDPSKSSLIVAELIGRLSAELAAVTAQLREVQASSPNSPQIPGLQRRIAALDAQINLEKQRVSTASDGLADKIAGYERLTLQREFAVKALASAVTSLEMARNEARRQQLYLERVVEPHIPDYAEQPLRVRSVVMTFGGSLVLFFVGWLILAGVREHKIKGK